MKLRPSVATFAAIGLLAASYFVLGRWGLSLAFFHASATAVWPPTGVSLAALLLLGTRVWPGVFLGAFLVNIMTQGTVATTLGIATGNTLEALVGAWLVRRFANGTAAFERTRDILAFVLFAALLSTMVSATLGVTSLSLGGFGRWQDYVSIWLTWWLGDMVSNLTVAPLFLIWAARPQPRPTRRQLLEGAAILLSLWGIGQVVFGGWNPLPSKHYPLAFLALPSLLWAALRFQQRGAIAASCLLSVVALVGTLRGLGPFVMGDPNASLLILQAFIGVTTVTNLVLAAVVSERVEAEQTLQAQERRMRAQKFALIGQLAAGVAHEINTPLQYIGSNITFLRGGFDSLRQLLERYERLREVVIRGEPVQAPLEELQALSRQVEAAYLQDEIPKAIQQSMDGVDRVTKIVHSIRTLSHPGEGAPRPADLNAIVENALTIAHNEVKYVANLLTSFDRSLPPLPCFEEELEQAILNILINAGQAVAEVVQRGGSTRGVIAVSTQWHAGRHVAEIRISDTGPGIPEALRAKIFEPFFTTKAVGQGTGQGLAMAHAIVVGRHRGTLTFDTRDGRGTTFIIQLPSTRV